MAVPLQLLKHGTAAAANAARRITRDTVGSLWVAACAHCNGASDGPICAACRWALDQMRKMSACRACGKTIASADSSCTECGGGGTHPVRRTIRMSPYAGVTAGMIRLAKFGGRWELATWLGQCLADQVAADDVPDNAVIVPVPLHRRRKLTRGYDQAKLIAAAAAKRLHRPLLLPLRRCRPTSPQTSLQSTVARMENVRDAFIALPRVDLTGLPVLLVDDVLTTGSTLRAAARALEPLRPSSITALVVAVAGNQSGGIETFDDF